ncbi:MAG TPA: hypothetical protein VHH90_04545 [Polyangia bacterium]|nr:hypothetical protein [Polyangia bacterium]
MRIFNLVFAISAPLVIGCASTGPGTMTASEHEKAARQESARADSVLQRAQAACPGYESQDACYRYWASFRNPTQKDLVDARRHRELAERHRAASQALRDAEARACVGVPDAERDISPFLHLEDIVVVEPIEVDQKGDTLSGVRVVFRPLPNMTADWLQHVVDCHLARNAVIGYPAASKDSCPLQVRNVTALVHPVPAGLAVDIRPRNPVASREVHIRTRDAAQYCASTAAPNPTGQ